MNESLSISSGYSSATNSNSNSLNRSTMNQSLILNNSSLINTSTDSGIVHTSSGHHRSRFSAIDHYLTLPVMTPVRRRRAKSQIVFHGDEVNTLAEHNKQLIEDVYLLKKQLKEKDETILKLNDIRNRLESEIQELSASLFEEAYSMVNTARAETAQYEKLLKEANGKIDVLQAEVKALKELVLTSTPSTPNNHLHPQLSSSSNNRPGHSRQSSLNQQSFNPLAIDSSSINGPNSNPNLKTSKSLNLSALENLQSKTTSISTPINNGCNNQTSNGKNASTSSSNANNSLQVNNLNGKTYKRISSHNETFILQNKQSFIDKLFQTSSSCNALKQNVEKRDRSLTVEIHEFDPIYFKELVEWRELPELKKAGAFMNRIYEEDVLPCLNFYDKIVSDDLLNAIEANTVCIEELTNAQQCAEAMIQLINKKKKLKRIDFRSDLKPDARSAHLVSLFSFFSKKKSKLTQNQTTEAILVLTNRKQNLKNTSAKSQNLF